MIRFRVKDYWRLIEFHEVDVNEIRSIIVSDTDLDCQ